MRVLIAYYSRTGITQKSCEAVADALNASDEAVEVQVEEIVDRTDRAGVLGYARGGKDAMLKKLTEIDPIEVDVASFDLVVIGTPVWAATCAPAVRTFCDQFAGSLPQVAFVATMGGAGDRGTFETLEELCGKPPVALLTLRERYVKSEDPENYGQMVRAFARQLVVKSAEG